MNIEFNQTFLQRRRIRHCHCMLLTVLILTVSVCAARGQEDLDKATVPSVEAVENKPHSDEFRVGGTRIIIVETSPGDSKTDVIRQIVQTLEKSNLADEKAKFSALPGDGITVQLRILEEVGHEPLNDLISGLGQLNLPELRISLDRDDTSNKGIISASTEASAEAVSRVTNYLTTQKFLMLTVTAPSESSVSDAAASPADAPSETTAQTASNTNAVRILALESRIADLESHTGAENPQLRFLKDELAKLKAESASGKDDASGNVAFATLITQLQAALMILQQDLGPNHPQVVSVKNQIAEIEHAADQNKQLTTVFRLQHANATETSEKIEQLYPERKTPVVVDERNNSLLIRGDQATIREYEQLLEVLDADNSSSPQQAMPPAGTSPFGSGGFGGLRSAPGAVGSSSTPAKSTTNNTVSPEEVPNDDTEQLKIFSLKFSNANDTMKIVQSLFGLPSVKVAADERTNSLIVSGDAGSLSEIEAILLKLDSNETAASPSNPLAAHSGGNSIAAPTPIAEFRQRLDALEQPVQQLAEQVRATEVKLGKDHTDSAKLRAELRALVQKTFTARQEIQRAELAEFTRRLQRMQQSIETREKIEEKIVDRRVEELLDPDATWEQGLPSSALAHETGNSNEVLPKKQAKRLAAEARQALKVGRLDLARSLAQQAKQLDISWDVFDDHPNTILADIDNLRSTGSNLLNSSNLDATEKNGLVFESAAAADQTSPPESDAEKAFARMVFVFFQDEARRAVPGLMIDHGTETLVLTGGSASIVPMGVGHAIDRSFIEIPGEPDVEAEFFVTKTADLRFHRAKPGLTKFKLEKAIDLAIGDSMSAIILSGKPTLRVTPNATRISALDQATSFSLDTHKFRHEFSGLVQIDQRLPEGTPLFKDGQLAGITLLGTRFMKDDVPGSYVVPASRIVEVLKTMKTE